MGGLGSDGGGARVISRCATPRGVLQLQRRGDDFEIIAGGTFLVASYGGSEARLGRVGLGALPGGAAGRGCIDALVAGLGMGLTLRACLDHPRVRRVDVVESSDAIVAWNRGPLREVNGDALADPRVTVVRGDFVRLTAAGSAEGPLSRYDLALIDIDNGPAWTVHDDNRALYTADGLGGVAGWLRPGGVMALWSAARCRGFEGSLAEAFPAWDVRRVAQRLGPGAGARRAWGYVYLGYAQGGAGRAARRRRGG